MSSSRLYALTFTAMGAAAVVAALVYYAPIDRVAGALVFAMGVGFFVGSREQWTRLGRLEQQIALLRTMSADAQSTGDAELDAWVDARTQGANVSLPGASYAPFLVGLFVMLGLLGTFLGLFETLRGARFALTAASDPQAMREGLTAPMLGLTRSFGCSATGVTTSACLGLVGMMVRGRENALSAALQRVVARRLQGRNPSARMESLLEALAGKFDTVATALGSMSLSMAGMGNSLDAGQKESLVRLEGSLTRHTEALGGLQATLTEGHARELARMGDALLTHADKVASPLLLQGDKLFGQMEAALKSVVDTEARMTAALSEATATMTQTLGATSASVTQTLAAATAAMTQDLATTGVGLGQALAAKTQELSGIWVQNAHTFQTSVAEAHAQHAATLVSQQSAHLDAQRESASALHAELAAAQATQHTALTQAAAAQLAALEAHLPRVIAPLESATQKMTEAALAHAESLQSTSVSLSGALQGSATGVTEALATAASTVSLALAGTATGLTDTLAKAGEQLTALMANSGATLSSSLLEAHAAQQISMQNSAATQTSALTDALSRQLTALETHVERVLAPLEGTTRGIADAVGGHADALRETMLAVTTAAQEARSGEVLHVQTVRELVTVAREGLVSVKVGGAELEAAASMFAAAATAHQEGARAWLGSLDAVDERVRQSGKAAATEALQKQLEYTHKIFGEQLRLHRELFEEVRGAQRVKEHLVVEDAAKAATAAEDRAHGI